MEVKLPRPGLVLDPRPNDPRECLFSIDYHDDGITVKLTLTRVDTSNDDSSSSSTQEQLELLSVSMRVYDPAIETVPRFDTTFYRYFGQDDEHAPNGTTDSYSHRSISQDYQKVCIFWV